MNDIDAKIVTLRTLFQEQVTYRIPSFQRPYTWGEDRQWKPLWSDIRDLAERCLKRDVDDEILPHFMGAIVLQLWKLKTGEVIKKIVVDGQQRLTTLQLLIKATEQVFLRQGDSVRANRLQELTTNQESYWGEDYNNETKIRQSNNIDQAAFLRVIIGNHDDDQSQSWAISEAYIYFKRKVGEWMDSAPENRARKADALEEALTEQLKMAAIDLNQDQKPHIIFETLNDRGEPLTQSDLVKNTVMYEAGVIDDPQRARSLWGMFDHDPWWRENTREGRSNRIHNDRFLDYWLEMRLQKDITTERVASEFRNNIATREESDDGRLYIEIVAEKIREAGKIYKDLEEVAVQEIEFFLKRMKVLEVGVVTPLLLWLYTTKVPVEKRLRSINVVESYIVRRMLCGLNSNNLSRIFINLLIHLEKWGDDNVSHADNIIVEYLNSQDISSQIWPDDHFLIEYLTKRPMRGKDDRKKMVLESIERELRINGSESLGSTDELTVEHIMPRKWEENWPLTGNDSDNIETKMKRNEALKTIGNLTLITGKLNSNISNGSWTRKREKLNEYSSLFLNKKLLDNSPEDWDEASISARSKWLTERILEIWPSADKFAESPT